MKKILILSRAPLDYRGGIPVYCKKIIEEFKLPITCVNYFLNTNNKNFLNNNWFNNFKKEVKEITFPSQFGFHTIYFSLGYFNWLFRNLKNYQYIHYQHPDPVSALILLFILNKKQKLITTWHAEVIKKIIFFPLIIIDILILIKSKNIIVFTKGHIKSSLILRRFFRRKLNIIELGVKPVFKKIPIKLIQKKFKDIKKRGSLNVIFIGRLVKYKGLDILLDSIKENLLINQLTIVGDGPLYNELQFQISNKDLNKKVSIINKATDEIRDELLLKNDLLILPSINQSEAYGIVQLEAMTMALPVIVSNLNNGVNCLSIHNHSGIHIKPKSKEAIMNSLKYILIDDNYIRLSSNAFYRSKELSLEKTVQKTSSLFNN